MSAHGTIVRIWSHGEDTFCLAKIGEQLDLEERCKAGIAAIMTRLQDGTWYINDVRETIRLGLIGGGMKPPAQAQEVVSRHVVPPLSECALLAFEILAAVMFAPHGEQPGKAEADRANPGEADSFKMDASFDPPFTAPDKSSDTIPEKSMQ